MSKIGKINIAIPEKAAAWPSGESGHSPKTSKDNSHTLTSPVGV